MKLKFITLEILLLIYSDYVISAVKIDENTTTPTTIFDDENITTSTIATITNEESSQEEIKKDNAISVVENINSTRSLDNHNDKGSVNRDNLKTQIFPIDKISKENSKLSRISRPKSPSSSSSVLTGFANKIGHSDGFKDQQSRQSSTHKTLQRHVSSQIPQIKNEFVASKPYSEQVFIPSPELKVGIYDEQQQFQHRHNFDTFQPIQPINVRYDTVKKVESNQGEEYQNHYHHFVDVSSYHHPKFDVHHNPIGHDPVPVQREYIPPSHKGIVFQSSVAPRNPSNGIISFPEYNNQHQHHHNHNHEEETSSSSEKTHYIQPDNSAPADNDDNASKENNPSYLLENEQYQQQQQHYHHHFYHENGQSNGNNNYEYLPRPSSSTTEIPPAPVTEDVKDIKMEHPYPFEVIRDDEIKGGNNYNFNNGEIYRDINNNNNNNNINQNHEIKPSLILSDEIHHQHQTTTPTLTQIETWNYKPAVHHNNHGKLIPKREPWKDVIHILSAVIPIGLLLTALTPNVIVVNPNSTVPLNRNPLNQNFNFYSKQRSDKNDGEVKDILNRKLNDVVTQLRTNFETLTPESKCIERAFCELLRKSDDSNTEKLQELLQLIVNKSKGFKDLDNSLSELFQIAKSNNCSNNYECHEKEAPEGEYSNIQ